ncbi:MAG: sigma-70 family RNA polymerase sigma factor [Pseudomonadota bacterium]
MLPEFAPDMIDRMVALRPALRRRAAFLIGKRTHIGSPEDFVQDAFVTALRSVDRYADDNLAGWLIAILEGHIRNASRRAHVRTSVPLVPAGAAEDGHADMMEFPVAANQELRLEVNDVVDALRKLSAADQEIIWLARVDELSHEQIAERLRVPLGTLHSRLSRATARLRDAYEAGPEMGTACAPIRPRRAA